MSMQELAYPENAYTGPSPRKYEIPLSLYEDLLRVSQRAPAIMLHCGAVSPIQEEANKIWDKIAKQLHFDLSTVREYSSAKGSEKYFWAVPLKPLDVNVRIHVNLTVKVYVKDDDMGGEILSSDVEDEISPFRQAVEKLDNCMGWEIAEIERAND